MSYEIKGTVKVIEDTQTFASGFQKKEFVITTHEKFPQDVKFEATKEEIEMVDALNLGDLVNVSFDVRGNEYKGRYYVNLKAWNIDVESKANIGEATGSIEESVPSPDDDGEDDAPF
jgi:single-strand DNA-binding protein